MNNISKGYITGYFDGEGYVGIDKHYVLWCQIGCTDLDILERFQLIFGGSISKKPLRKLDDGSGYSKQEWQWRIFSNDALKFFELINSYPIVKRKQIELAIKYQKIKMNSVGSRLSQHEIEIREWFKKEIEKLNNEIYDEKTIKDYDSEIEKLKVDKEIREGRQSILDFSSNEIGLKILNLNEINVNKSIDVLNINMPNDVFIGYCAGFFDGEGCVYLEKNYRLRVHISQTNYDVLKLINKNFGGNVYKLKLRRAHSSEGYRKQEWIWRISSNDSLPFLRSVQSYLLIKKQQIDLAIKYQENKYKLSVMEKGWYRQKLMELKESQEITSEIMELKNVDNKQCKLDKLM